MRGISLPHPALVVDHIRSHTLDSAIWWLVAEL